MRGLLVSFLLSFFAANASALPITFIHSGLAGSGSLDGIAFGPTAFTFTSSGDTGDRQDLGVGFFIDHLDASINLEGIGTFDFLTGTRTFVNNRSELVGFSLAGSFGADLYNGGGALFSTWNMLSSIGPVAGPTQLLQWDFSSVSTSGGDLVFDNASTSGTFQAVVGDVPTPATLALMALGLAGLGWKRCTAA